MRWRPVRRQAIRQASASADRTVRLWDLASGKQLQRFHGAPVGSDGFVKVLAVLWILAATATWSPRD